MRLALVFLDKASGQAHFAYAHAKIMSARVQMKCFLSAQNVLLEDFRKLPCEVEAFDWPRGQKSLFRALVTGTDPTGIAHAVDEYSPDIVLDTHSIWWSGVVDKKLGGKYPIAEVVHDVVAHPGPLAKFYSLYDVLFPSKADIAVALSEYTAGQLLVKYPRKSHITSRHGIFHSRDAVDADAVASARHKFLFFGRIEPYKGLDVLVEAFAQAKESNPSVELDVIGSGAISPSSLRRIKDLGVGLVNTYVSDEDARAAMESHGVLVLPYTSATQSGVAAIALGNGLPCIASSVGALSEQIVDGVSGLIVPPGDAGALAEAMLRIAGDHDLARRMSLEAYRIGQEDYSWDTISARLLDDLGAYLAKQDKEQ